MTRAVAPLHPTKDFLKDQRLADQFDHLYFTRFTQLSRYLTSAFDGPPCDDILKSSGQIWFIGTTFSHMQNSPNILKDVSSINHGQLPSEPTNYSGDDDRYFLQPNTGRPIPLTGSFEKLVTGCVIAAKGQMNDGKFVVEEIRTPGFEIPPHISSPSKGKIIFLSGLNLDLNESNIQVSMLLDYLSGCIADTSALTQVVICGDSLQNPPPKLIGSRITRPVLGTAAIFEFVKLIQQFARNLPVHLMPGQSDPAPSALPQKPFHKGLFAGARDMIQAKALYLHSNPAAFATEEGLQFLGTSGQPILDLLKYDASIAPIDHLCRTLDWRHLAPTAPDTLPTYAYSSNDPLIIDMVPHVYFAGNMPEFATKVYKGVRTVCIPRFSETKQIVELDLETLEAEAIRFAK